jgi:hypothetical protein
MSFVSTVKRSMLWKGIERQLERLAGERANVGGNNVGMATRSRSRLVVTE